MPLFTIACIDKPGAGDLRVRVRPAHLDWLKGQGALVRLAGPWLDEAGRPIGSLLIVEAPDLAAARTFAAYDPYGQAGLFAEVQVRAWRVAVGGFGANP